MTKVRENLPSMDEVRELSSLIWKALSIRVLKRYLGIETKAYMEWHDRRAYNLQCKLDWEHCTNYAKSYK